MIKGFKNFKPLITIYSTQLCGKYYYTLLYVITQCSNRGIFPLTFALVEKEWITIWFWFMAYIHKHDMQRLVLRIIFDRHTGILATMEEQEWQLPYAHHRFFIRHFLVTLRKGEFEKLFFGMTTEQRKPPKVIEGLTVNGTTKR